MFKRLLHLAALGCILASDALPATAPVPGYHTPAITDIIVLDSVSQAREIVYAATPYIGNTFAFEVRYINLDTLNYLFGDTVTGGAFDVSANGQPIGAASGFAAPAFTLGTWSLPDNAIGDSVVVALTLGAGSDPAAFHRPCLLTIDDTPPASVTNLAATARMTEIVLTWTASGDDGNDRRAAACEARFSTAEIGIDTAAWWQAAVIIPDMPAPSIPGQTDSVIVAGLDTSTTYYFVVRTSDELGNVSAFSNVASATTESPHGNFCLRYEGTHYAEVPFDSLLNTGNQLTIEAWFNLDGTYTWNHASILDKPAPGHFPPFYQYNMGPANRTDFFAHVAINGDYDPFELYNVVQTDTWTHAAVTFDGASRKVYLNGIRADSVYDPGQMDSFDTGVRIGFQTNFDGWGFKGFIDEIRIWNVARTGQEIFQYMNHPLSGDEPNLVAYWNFNEGFGQAIRDLTAHAIDGRLGYADTTDECDPTWAISTAPIDTMIIDGIDGPSASLPIRISVEPNYPNPFNDGTKIGFALPATADITLEIYDMLGRRVRTLAEGPFASGRHSIVWDGRAEDGAALSSGVYFCKMTSGDFAEARKLVMVR